MTCDATATETVSLETLLCGLPRGGVGVEGFSAISSHIAAIISAMLTLSYAWTLSGNILEYAVPASY